MNQHDQAITRAVQQHRAERGLEAMRELVMQRIDHVQALMTESQIRIQMALDLSATDVLRRLDGLNGEAERLRNMQATYLPREVYTQNYNEMARALQGLREQAAASAGRGQVIAAGVSTLVSLAVGLVFIAVAYALRAAP